MMKSFRAQPPEFSQLFSSSDKLRLRKHFDMIAAATLEGADMAQVRPHIIQNGNPSEIRLLTKSEAEAAIEAHIAEVSHWIPERAIDNFYSVLDSHTVLDMYERGFSKRGIGYIKTTKEAVHLRKWLLSLNTESFEVGQLAGVNISHTISRYISGTNILDVCNIAEASIGKVHMDIADRVNVDQLRAECAKIFCEALKNNIRSLVAKCERQIVQIEVAKQ